MNANTAKNEFEKLCHKAVECHKCFEKDFVEPSLNHTTIKIAQPRWIGQAYWDTSPRVLVIMINPGAGNSKDIKRKQIDDETLALLQGFASQEKSLYEFFDHQKEDAKRWRDGKLVKFYTDDLGLEFEKIAFANIAWCSTNGNNYPSKMLEQCFSEHTQKLLNILSPNIVLLSGGATHRFENRIELPSAKIIKILHFAHRKGPSAWKQQAMFIRQEIESWNSPIKRENTNR